MELLLRASVAPSGLEKKSRLDSGKLSIPLNKDRTDYFLSNIDSIL